MEEPGPGLSAPPPSSRGAPHGANEVTAEKRLAVTEKTRDRQDKTPGATAATIVAGEPPGTGASSLKSMARRVVAITNRVTNSPELNNNSLKEGLLEKMMGMARGDEYIQPLGASKATIAASSKKKGGMFNKYLTHPKMKRRIEKPRILLLDCRLEYKKGKSQTNIEVMKEDDFNKILEQGEAHIKKIYDEVTASKPDLVITEKGAFDRAQHFFNKASATAVRRLRKSDNRRVARACGATIVNKTDEITEDDIGTGAGLVEVRKIGEKHFPFIERCKDPEACTIRLCGASKDILNEVERNRQDALEGARNLYQEPSLVSGGGATEVEVAHRLREEAKTLIEIARTPDEEIGDGTTSIIVLTTEMMGLSHQSLEEKRNPPSSSSKAPPPPRSTWRTPATVGMSSRAASEPSSSPGGATLPATSPWAQLKCSP